MNHEENNRRTYEAFVSAWAAADLERLMTYVTDDIVYGASVGPDPGATYVGKPDVREGFRIMMAYDRGKAMSPAEATFLGDRGFVEWKSGEVRGFDVLSFRDGLISRKEAFRKTRA